MGGIADIAALYGIIMNVIDLLAQHGLPLNLLGMAAFFPDLMFAVVFMPLFEKVQLLQDAARVLLFQVFENKMPLRGKRAALESGAPSGGPFLMHHFEIRKLCFSDTSR